MEGFFFIVLVFLAVLFFAAALPAAVYGNFLPLTFGITCYPLTEIFLIYLQMQ